MKCKECKFEPVCDGLLHTRVRLGITTCRQGMKARVVKKKPVAKVVKAPKKPKPAPMKATSGIPASKTESGTSYKEALSNASTRSDNSLA